MKRNNSPRSSYRKKPAPMSYSALYHQWRAALRAGKPAEARAAGEAHTARFLPRRRGW